MALFSSTVEHESIQSRNMFILVMFVTFVCYKNRF